MLWRSIPLLCSFPSTDIKFAWIHQPGAGVWSGHRWDRCGNIRTTCHIYWGIFQGWACNGSWNVWIIVCMYLIAILLTNFSQTLPSTSIHPWLTFDGRGKSQKYNKYCSIKIWWLDVKKLSYLILILSDLKCPDLQWEASNEKQSIQCNELQWKAAYERYWPAMKSSQGNSKGPMKCYQLEILIYNEMWSMKYWSAMKRWSMRIQRPNEKLSMKILIYNERQSMKSG